MLNSYCITQYSKSLSKSNCPDLLSAGSSGVAHDMSFTVIKAPSTLAKEARRSNAATAAETDDKVEKVNRREDHKKQKELEEARKAGTVPAMKDEEGKLVVVCSG